MLEAKDGCERDGKWPHAEPFHSCGLWSKSTSQSHLDLKENTCDFIQRSVGSRDLFKSMASSPQSRGAVWNLEWEYLPTATGYSPYLVRLAFGKMVPKSTKKTHVGQRLHPDPYPSHHSRAAKRLNLYAIPSSCLLLKNLIFKKVSNEETQSYKDGTNNFSMHFTYCELFASIIFLCIYRY